MLTLHFPSLDAATLLTGLLSAEVLMNEVRWWRDGEILCVLPSGGLPKKAVTALGGLGIVCRKRDVPADCQRGATWFELNRPVSSGEVAPPQVLFHCPNSESAVSVATEMWRLGCDRQRLLGSDAGALLLASSPPYFTLCRARDWLSGLRAFMPLHDRCYIEVGYAHPWASVLRAPDGCLLFLSAEGRFTTFADGEFVDLHTLATLVAPTTQAIATRPFDAPIVVKLRLRPTAPTRSALWVIDREPQAQLERLLGTLPEAVIADLRFLPAKLGDRELFVLHHPHAEGLELPLDAYAYSSHPQLPNLYLPVGRVLEPPLRHERLRELFVPDHESLVWVGEHGDDLHRHCVRAPDFFPLGRFVDYVIDQHRQAVQPWVESTLFELDTLVVVDRPEREEVSVEDSADSVEEDHQSNDATLPARDEPQRPPPRSRKKSVDKTKKPALPSPVLSPISMVDSTDPSPLEEQALAALVDTGELPDEVLLPLARHYWSARRWLDAAACLSRWLWAGHTMTELDAPFLTKTGNTSAGAEQAAVQRTVIAAIDFLNRPPSLPKATAFLTSDGLNLDVRLRWLVYLSAIRGDRVDALGLSRAYDAVLADLRSGLDLSRDLPAFLRAYARNTDADSCRALAASLDDSEATVRASTKHSDATGFYLAHVFAFGKACLQQVDDARTTLAIPLFQSVDAIHRWLIDGYRSRIRQASDGLWGGPLPDVLQSALAALPKFDRYKVDRLRSVSYVLEPEERVEPFFTFQSAETSAADKVLRLSDPAELAAALQKLLSTTKTLKDPVVRGRVCLSSLDVFGRLHPSSVPALLERVIDVASDIDPYARAAILERAVQQAALFGHVELLAPLVEPLQTAFSELDTDRLPQLLMGSLQSLRRVGYRQLATTLCETLASRLDNAAPLAARILMVGAQRFLGQARDSAPLLQAALDQFRKPMVPKERVQLIRALTRASLHVPLPEALALMHQMAQTATHCSDNLSTNSHFSLSTLALAEAIANATWSRAEAGRGQSWLQLDESRVRKRMNDDYTTLMESQTP